MADDPRDVRTEREWLRGLREAVCADPMDMWLIASVDARLAELAGVNAADPLRVLLADEARALEAMSAASWLARCHTEWADQTDHDRADWSRQRRAEHVAVLAALRKEASGG